MDEEQTVADQLTLETGGGADATELAAEAVTWGFPLVLSEHYYQYAKDRGYPDNQFLMNDKLATPQLKIAGPNVDTLYGIAWIDLAEGPQVVDVPDTAGRYYSLHLHSTYLDTFYYIGSRETGTGAGSFVLVPPGWVGEIPAGMIRLDAPTSRLVVVARTHVRHPGDEGEAIAIQSRFTLGALSAYPDDRRAPIVMDGALGVLPPLDLTGAGVGFFDELCKLVARFPPPDDVNRAQLARFGAIGVVPGAEPSANPELAPILAAAVKPTLEGLKASNFMLEKIRGWWVNNKVDSYESGDFRMRGAINYWGPAWHLVQEALYYSTTEDADGRPLDAGSRYRLKFDPGCLPPVNAFWSMMMYGADWSLVDNAIDRYAIGSCTPGLRYAEDGSLELLVQRAQPEEGQANWLPTPQDGPFMIFFRMYQPGPTLIDGSYVLPRLQLVRS